MIESDEEPPVKLPARERWELLALGALVGLIGFALFEWWPLFALHQIEAIKEIARGMASG